MKNSGRWTADISNVIREKSFRAEVQKVNEEFKLRPMIYFILMLFILQHSD